MPKQNPVSSVNILKVFDKDTLLHLRIPFSFYLLPVFCFAFSQTESIYIKNSFLIFIILHFFIYPASNCYNSFMDKDTKSIGALENPPPVTIKLYLASIILDVTGLILSLFIGLELFLMLTLYILVSKAYSWHGIRIKKYPILSWLIVSFFQGGFTFLLINMCMKDSFSLLATTEKEFWCILISTLQVAAVYPLTQIYQHEEDAKRGDITISYLLGIKGTFIFSALLFAVIIKLFHFYFTKYFSLLPFYIFSICLLPVLAYFAFWFLKVLKNSGEANFANTMRLNNISSVCLIICFILLFFINAENFFPRFFIFLKA